MRLFVAVDLPPDVLRVAGETIDAIRARAPRLDVRWVPIHNMHLTVRFIGWVSGDRAGALIARVTQPMVVSPFRVVLGACGAFPERGAPRVVWIGLREGEERLAQLNTVMNERLDPLGYPAEDRPFSAHLTLARASRGARLSRAVRDELAHVRVPPAEIPVSEAVLYESRLSPHGPRYEAL